MPDGSKEMADSIAGVMGSIPALSDVPDDETVTVRFGWFNHPRRDDTSGFSMSAVFGADPDDWHSYLEEHVGPRLDRRKLQGDGTTYMGTITLRGDGTVAGHTVKDEYLKPSERD